MGFAVQVTQAPAVEPVSLAELKLWCRVDADFLDDDDLIRSLGVTARRLVERTFDVALVTQTLTLTLDRFPIPGSPYLYQQYSWGYWTQRIPMMNLAGSWWPERTALFVPRPPLQSVSSITYTAQDGTNQTVATSNYTVDTARLPGRIVPAYGKFWPFTQPTVDAVVVTYVAGYGTPVDGAIPSVIPEQIKTALKIAVNQWYEHREDAGKLPDAAIALLMSEWHGSYY